MPVITRPAVILKTNPGTFQLSKSTLAGLTQVSSDAYFSVQTNWKQIIVLYKSSIGGQNEALMFDPSLSNPTAIFSVSSKVRDTFQMQAIVIKDFDGGELIIPRKALIASVSEYDFVYSAAVVPLSFEFRTGASIIVTGDDHTVSVYPGTPQVAIDSTSLGVAGIYEASFDLANLGAASNIEVGFTNSTTTLPASGFYCMHLTAGNLNWKNSAAASTLLTAFSPAKATAVFKLKRISATQVELYLDGNLLSTVTQANLAAQYPFIRFNTVGKLTKAFKP